MNLRSLIHLGVLAALFVLGFLLWHLLPPQPRCHIPSPLDLWHVSQDGQKLFLASRKRLEIWDTATGQFIRDFPWHHPEAATANYDPYARISTNDRYLLRLVDDRHLLLDLAEGREYSPNIGPAKELRVFGGDDTSFVLESDEERVQVEFATGQIIYRELKQERCQPEQEGGSGLLFQSLYETTTLDFIAEWVGIDRRSRLARLWSLEHMYSGDHQILVTQPKNSEMGFDVWELPLRPPWGWVVGPPLAMWLLFWMYDYWVTRPGHQAGVAS